MPERPSISHLIIVPRLQVQNANAISSALTHGFPSITAFTGLMWALERKTRLLGLDLKFEGVGVVVHAHDEQLTKHYFADTFLLTRNPHGKDGKPQPIVEEGRMHMTISLVFGVQSTALDSDHEQKIAQQVKQVVEAMRIAGGSVVPSTAPKRLQEAFFVPALDEFSEPDSEINGLCKRLLLPGFTLVERQDLLDERYEELAAVNDDATRLDAWLSLSRFDWQWHPDDPEAEEGGDKAKGKWSHNRQGYLVPIPVGYSALSDCYPAGAVAGARDDETEFRFVEGLYGVGEWLGLHRLTSIGQCLWYPYYDLETGEYRCSNHYARNSQSDFID